jgi:transcriptional regulator with XRE-family HTH domain
MSQEDLAQILDLKRTSVTNIESGRQKVTVDTLYRLCEHFGIEIDELMPPAADFKLASGRSVVIGGKSTDVGVKTASLVERLRPSTRGTVGTRARKSS